MASAWLIRRFIDPEARFGFAKDREKTPNDALPFDMFGVEFGHRGSNCTFETLCEVFGIADPAVVRVASIVHDLDLKDGRFGAAESETIGALIDGLQLAHADDHELLDRGMTLFESLYRTFAHTAKKPRPRQVARPRITPSTPLALRRAGALLAERHPQCHANRSWIARQARQRDPSCPAAP